MALQKVIKEIIADSAIDATRLDVEGDGTFGQVLISSGDGSFEWAENEILFELERNNYTGDGSTVSFTLSSPVQSKSQTQVYFDGVYQSKNNYTASGNVITFTEAPTSGIEIEVMHSLSMVVEENDFIGDGSTTSFAITSTISLKSQTQVYIDGVYQSKSNYTTSGNAITFTTAPYNDANIEVVHLLPLTAFVMLDSFIGDGSTSEYTLSQELSSENNAQVYFDGIYQFKDTYSVLDSVITFSENVPVGVNVEIINLKAGDTTSLKSILIAGDGVTTEFNLPRAVYSNDKTFVFLQGVYQEKSTYSVNGSTISFDTAPQDGYTVEVITFASVTIDEVSTVQKGSTSERPESTNEGSLRYNTDTKKLELYNGAGWFNIGPDYVFTVDTLSLTADSDQQRIDSTTY